MASENETVEGRAASSLASGNGVGRAAPAGARAAAALREETVTLFPQGPHHRLIGGDLEVFLERVAERLVALGEGAHAQVRAGAFAARADTIPALFAALDAARAACGGRCDLELRLSGDAHDGFARYVGGRRVELELRAFVRPQPLRGLRRCAACRWPLDSPGAGQAARCARPACGAAASSASRVARATATDELEACWWVRLFGWGPDGIGERFVLERRRLEGSPFYDALEGAGRTRLYEWQAWS